MKKQALQKITSRLMAASMIVMLVVAALPINPARVDSITVTLTTSGSWTVPTGVTSIKIECWGGGGGGGSRTSNGSGGGGGGGAYAIKNTYAVTPGSNIPYTIGAGGAAGSNGGSTTFDTVNNACVASGGNGVPNNTTTGGQGGTTGTGDVIYAGGYGYTWNSGNYGAGGGGSGGSAIAGNNTAPTNATNNLGAAAVTGGGPGGDGRTGSSGNGNTPASGPGGGGGGAYRSSGITTRSGGAGYRGQITITYSYPAPVIGTVTVSPDANGYTSASPTVSASVTSAVLPTCEYTTNGSTWVAGVVSGASSPYTCTGSPAGLGGSLTLNVRATNANGTGEGVSISRTVDSTGPTDGSLIVTPGNTQNGLSWTAATDGGIGMRAANTYDVRFLAGVTPPSCSTGSSIYTGTLLTATHLSLINGTQYSYRVCAYDAANNASTGATGSGIPVGVPTLTSPTAASIAATTATLGATVTSNGGAELSARGTCWGTTPAPTTNCLAEGGTAVSAFTQARTGLTGGTQYYYRGYAANSSGPGYSPDGSFYTEPTTQATVLSFTAVSGTSMTINWTRGTGDGVIVLMKAGSSIAGTPADGTYSGYVANPIYGSGTLITDGYVVYKGTGTNATVTGLTISTAYYIAVYEYKGAVDTLGAAQGTNYKTPGLTGNQATTSGTPIVTTLSATAVKRTGALLNGTVNANGSSATVTFEYGLTVAYGSTITAAQSPVTGSTNTAVSAQITGMLTPGTLYHFRVVAVAGVTTIYGGDLTFTTSPAGSITYYVNNAISCSDSYAGTDPANPFCTISKGALIADAGDKVSVQAGTYAETVKPNYNGGVGMPITFLAASGVTVTGEAGNFTNGGGFRLYNKGYIVIDGFTITGTADYGIYVSTSHDITIQNNKISYSGSTTYQRSGIYLTTTINSTVKGNTTDHNTQDGIRLNSGANYNWIEKNISFGNATQIDNQATGIILRQNSNYNTIIRNITYANEDTGLNFYTGSSHNLVINNLTYGNGDHGIDNNGAPYNTFIGNTVHGNVTVGINVEMDSSGNGSGGAVLMNNISTDNGYLRLVGGGTLDSTHRPGNIRVDATSITSPAATTLNYDLVYTSDASHPIQVTWGSTTYTSMAAFKATGQEANGLEGNPKFLAPAPIAQQPPAAPYNVAINVGDYHIDTGSPAIDSANSDAPSEQTVDIEGSSRVDDLTTPNTGAGTRAYDDRGAYEYQIKSTQTISWGTTAPTAATYQGPTYTPSATATSGLAVTITVDSTASSVCSISAGVVSFIGVGTCVLNANQAGNISWAPAPQVQQTFTVGKGTQSISVTTHAPTSAAYLSSFSVAATASSGLPVTYTATGVCTNVGATFTINSATGTCTVHYTQAGGTLYNAAPEIAEVVTATNLAQTITVTTNAPANAAYLSSFSVAATASSGLLVTYSSSGACTNSGATFTMSSGTGTCVVHYNQSGSVDYAAAPEITESVAATKIDQTITFSPPASPAAYHSSFTVSPTSSSGLAVTVTPTGICSIVGYTVTMNSSTGTCTLTASQAGDANYNPAVNVVQTVLATMGNQVILITKHAPATATYLSSFSVAATASSGLPVTYSASGACTNSGAIFTMTSGVGTCFVYYNQAGDANYNAAPEMMEFVVASLFRKTYLPLIIR